mmetsp:Transcript_26297/g.53636  ORF Transcript_26297/g.53636 Transcript_26297/m.53636 type:complete len:150 (-) Transcript_26297:223-672(-)|eukprot:CAMPEP_0181289740 /NCGR_PEP_ID=MMETSP1101-20121128/1045_1 /TAXON_ID=46948 /ORGANISM="Rhodomonas abbreviata, Strain Caron Lab Isolate" /LENGTH=149 /DNA_ID=CAMNT_0023393985 /DNA_START=72 /DNA_END=521 /DNA_ORIENTATION=+
MASWATELFGPELLTKEGLKPTAEALEGKTRIGIYFSAHWCPPCRGFTPKLAEFFTDAEAEDGSLQIIFASSDQDEAQFAEYYDSMPWLAVPFSATEKIQALGSKFGVRGIPALHILDAADGSVKDADGRATVGAYNGSNLAKITGTWA